jgi:hypothetical protein
VIAAASDSDEHTRKFAAFAIGNAGNAIPGPLKKAKIEP